MKDHGPWRILGSEIVYADPWIEVQRDRVIRPDRREGTHCIVRLLAGVSVLAVDDQRQVYLTDEFHYGVGRRSLEAVSGGIEHGESALDAAQRELREELGIGAAGWTSLGSVDPFTTVVVSPTALYLARELSWGPTQPEGTEQIDVVKVPFDEALAWVFDGRITHAPTCVLLLKAQRLLDR